MKNLTYLVAAYAVIWIVLFGYILNLLKKQKVLSREIDRLKTELEKNNS